MLNIHITGFNSFIRQNIVNTMKNIHFTEIDMQGIKVEILNFYNTEVVIHLPEIVYQNKI